VSIQSRQKGAALIVSMLLIFITGTVGVVVMRGSINESKNGVATVIEQATFSAAESAVMQAHDEVNLGELPLGVDTDVAVKATDERIAVKVTARQDGMVPMVNSSLRLFGIASFSIRGVAEDDDIGASRKIISGVALRVPLEQ